METETKQQQQEQPQKQEFNFEKSFSNLTELVKGLTSKVEAMEKRNQEQVQLEQDVENSVKAQEALMDQQINSHQREKNIEVMTEEQGKYAMDKFLYNLENNGFSKMELDEIKDEPTFYLAFHKAVRIKMAEHIGRKLENDSICDFKREFDKKNREIYKTQI